MSIQSAKIFEDIIMSLSVLRYIFKSRSKKGLYDLNKKAESFFKEVLNQVYDWDLINLNEIQSNYPAIDLGDERSRTCIQVTAENSSAKIAKTIEKFLEKKLYKNYDRLIIFIITDKKNYSTTFETKKKFKFSISNDIQEIDDLLTDVEKLPIEKLEVLHKFLKKELSEIISATVESGSLLARAEKKILLEPKNGQKFLMWLNYADEEIKQGLIDIRKFYGKLTALPKSTREYLHLILWNGSEAGQYGFSRTTIIPRKLESLVKMSREESIEEFRILEEEGIASVDEDGNVRVIEVSYHMDTGVDLLSSLKEFSKSESTLIKIIVDCDFTLLDAE